MTVHRSDLGADKLVDAVTYRHADEHGSYCRANRFQIRDGYARTVNIVFESFAQHGIQDGDRQYVAHGSYHADHCRPFGRGE